MFLDAASKVLFSLFLGTLGTFFCFFKFFQAFLFLGYPQQSLLFFVVDALIDSLPVALLELFLFLFVLNCSLKSLNARPHAIHLKSSQSHQHQTITKHPWPNTYICLSLLSGFLSVVKLQAILL